MINKVEKHPKVQIKLNSEVVKSSGFKGNFRSNIKSNGSDQVTLNHGITILATGGEEYRGHEYGYGEHQQIITLNDLEYRFAEGELSHFENSPGTIVMVQCVCPGED